MIDSSLLTILFNMQRLKSQHGFSWSAADCVLVLHEGHIEAGVADEVVEHPAHTFTRSLVDANPWPNSGRRWPELDSDMRRLVDRLDHPISGYQLEPVEKAARTAIRFDVAPPYRCRLRTFGPP
jgi:ABC-type dipeptide/oligopeptide/nickel transport system ATPase component